MSRRKDQERFMAMKRLDPSYPGFRGREKEPTAPGQAQLVSIVCSVCARKRNIPVGIAQEQGDKYVCLSCQEEQESR